MEKLSKRSITLAIRDNEDKLLVLNKIKNMTKTDILNLKNDYESNIETLRRHLIKYEDLDIK